MSEKIKEVDIKHFVKSILKNKFLIIIIIVAFALTATVYSFANNYKIYESKTTLSLRFIDKINTSYGELTLPVTDIEDYVNFVLNSNVIEQTYNNIEAANYTSATLQSKISTQTNRNIRTFSISVKGDNSQETYDIATTHLNIYLNYVELLLRELAVEFFINGIETNVFLYEKNINLLTREIESGEILLESIPKFLNEQADSTSYEYRIINPLYEQAAYEIALKKTTLNTIQNELLTLNINLDELNEEKDNLSEDIDLTQRTPSLYNSFSNLKGVITVIEEPQEGVVVDSQNHINIILFGLVLGFIISIVFVSIKEYWKFM